MSASTKRPVGRPRLFTDEAIFTGFCRVLTRSGGGVTIAVLAAEIGCTGPMLVKRFGSRQGLLAAYLRWCLAATTEHARVVKVRESTPLARLRAFLAPPAATETARENAASLAHLNGVLLETRDDDLLRRLMQRRYDLYAGQTQRFLEAAVEAGELLAVATDRLAHLLIAAVMGTALRRGQSTSDGGESEPDRSDVVTEVLAPYLRGRGTPSTNPL